MILLDTDILIDLIRRYPPALVWLQSLGEEEVNMPGFVVMEIIQGCRSKAEQERTERELSEYAVVWPSEQTLVGALKVYTQYHLSHNLGILDALIGQTAVALDLPLHTFNQKHYAAIPNLKTIQPYTKPA